MSESSSMRTRSKLALVVLGSLLLIGLLPSTFYNLNGNGINPENESPFIDPKLDLTARVNDANDANDEGGKNHVMDWAFNWLQLERKEIGLTAEELQALEDFDDISHPITMTHANLIKKRATALPINTDGGDQHAAAPEGVVKEQKSGDNAAKAHTNPDDQWKKGDGPITNSQIVLLIIYISICSWVGFWELILFLRVITGRPRFAHSVLVIHAHGAGGEDGQEKKDAEGGEKGGAHDGGATTFIPVFNIWTYSEETQKIGRAAVLFGTIILLFYLVDGPRAWHGPDNRAYNRDLFMFICTVIAVMGFLTIRDTHKKNTSILNREQTEEWKGYMQIGFVLYHYFAAKETYNIIRVFIAAYVWMTGFGNFSYFWIRKDYSFVRLIKMLIRLNWLVFFVCVVMDKDYMLYYVCPLHTFYFMTVYVTMAIYPEKNYEPFWMRVKFGLLFLFLFILFEIPGIFEIFWRPLHFILKYEDSLHEWEFRAGLDHYCALLGMLYAYNYPAIEAWLKKVESYPAKQEMAIKSIITGVSLAIFIGWTIICVPMNKYSYNSIHPYVSVIPYTAYIILRNISLKSRGWVMGLFQWSGRITLETYIAQFHLWLVNDAKGRLVYIDGYPLMNFVIATSVYLLVSSLLFDTTVILNDALIPQGTNSHNASKRLSFFVIVWVSLYSLIALTRLI